MVGVTLERTAYAGQAVVQVTLVDCPARDCDHRFKHYEQRWRHFLEEHGPEDFGLEPLAATDGGERP